MAVKTNLGRIVPVPVGAWSAATTYSKLDIVSYTNGSSYISKKDSNVNHNPATSSEWWQLLAEKGEKGRDGGGALSDTNPLKDSGTQGSAGTSSSVSRADHVHPLNVNNDENYKPQSDNGSGTAGTANYYARSDHAHPLQIDETTGYKPSQDTVDGNGGSAQFYARSDHAHPLNVDDSVARSVDAGTIGNAGSSVYYARADHAHPANVTNTKPVKDSGTTGNVGSKSFYARSDHAHPLNVDDSVARSVDAANFTKIDDPENPEKKITIDLGIGFPGESSAYARADHAHPLNVSTTIPPQDTENGSDGASGYYARADHAHPLNVSSVAPAPVSINVAISTDTTLVVPDLIGSVGSSSAYARADHVHPLGFAIEEVVAPSSATVTQGVNYRTNNFPYQVGETGAQFKPIDCPIIPGYMPIGIVGYTSGSQYALPVKMFIEKETIDGVSKARVYFNFHMISTSSIGPIFYVLYAHTEASSTT